MSSPLRHDCRLNLATATTSRNRLRIGPQKFHVVNLRPSSSSGNPSKPLVVARVFPYREASSPLLHRWARTGWPEHGSRLSVAADLGCRPKTATVILVTGWSSSMPLSVGNMRAGSCVMLASQRPTQSRYLALVCLCASQLRGSHDKCSATAQLRQLGNTLAVWAVICCVRRGALQLSRAAERRSSVRVWINRSIRSKTMS